MNINTKERQGSAIALWGVAVMAGPVLGPVLGGWLTEAYSWRYVFYIDLPIGVLAFLGMTAFLPDSARKAGDKLDWFGFGTLSLAIGAMQIALDRCERHRRGFGTRAYLGSREAPTRRGALDSARKCRGRRRLAG